MSDLTIRKIPFSFDGVSFLWNPENPGFSLMMNQISFLVIGLEKYFCRATAEAEKNITDPWVLDEAQHFRAQEQVHSQAHRKHCKALIAQYPGLGDTLRECTRLYDELYDHEELKFHLAYQGGLEAAFTPFFRMILDNRDVLFGAGDARVASLMLWHFCEEIEHRSSALAIYNHAVGSSFYRIRMTPKFYRHAGRVFAFLAAEFRKHVTDAPAIMFEQPPFAAICGKDKRAAVLGVLRSQLPGHDPAHERIPEYFAEWNRHYDAGEDVTQIYGRRVMVA